MFSTYKCPWKRVIITDGTIRTKAEYLSRELVFPAVSSSPAPDCGSHGAPSTWWKKRMKGSGKSQYMTDLNSSCGDQSAAVTVVTMRVE